MGWRMCRWENLFDDNVYSPLLRWGGLSLWAQGSHNDNGASWGAWAVKRKIGAEKYPGGIFCAEILEDEKAFGERFFSFGA